jgi:diguanylate cyclase (GGDEF)-like protein/putative nucleotidyltransferase with HDIG domain
MIMTEFIQMPRKVHFYWALIVLGGAWFSITSIASTDLATDNVRRTFFYIVAAILASRLKIRLPGIFVTLSMNYVVILAALMNLGRASGMIVGVASALGQCFIHADQRPKWYHLLFNMFAMAFPVMAADLALQSQTLNYVDPTGALSLLMASLLYFIMNTVTVAGIISVTSSMGLLTIWRDSYLWTSPQYLVGGLIAGGLHFMNRYLGWPALIVAIPPLYLVYRSYSVYLGRFEEQRKHITEMAQLHLRTIETLALAIDAKDDTTAAHLRRVQVYASEIGKELHLSALEMQALEAAALLHDVGKLAVPEYIISKPGKLTPDEFEKMKVHPVVGAEILERVHFPYPVVPIVRSHHEKYDGTGYPDGLIGENIPIGARILSAVDCLDALASNRQYRTAMPLEAAMQIIRDEAGKAFDPVVVAILDRRFRELEQKARDETADYVKLSSNVKVERGLAPATGFAESAPVSAPSATAHFSLAISGARREFQLLLELTNDLGSSLSLEETLALLAVRLGKIVNYDAIAVYLLDGDKLVPKFVKGESFRLLSSLEIPLGQGLSGWVAENDLPVVNGNPAVEPGYLNDPRMVTPLRSAIAVPIRGRDGVIAVLTLYHLKAEAFSQDDRRILLAIAPKAGIAIQNSVRFERANSAADTDELTGLHNARSLFRHLEAEVSNTARREGNFTVVVMDLDGFKKANDEYGHIAGNRILECVGRALRRSCRAGDFAARLGGDEFVLIMPDATQSLPEILARLDQIGRSLPAESQCPARITISAGVSRYPEDGSDAEALLEKADERMYDAKRSKKLLQVA